MKLSDDVSLADFVYIFDYCQNINEVIALIKNAIREKDELYLFLHEDMDLCSCYGEAQDCDGIVLIRVHKAGLQGALLQLMRNPQTNPVIQLKVPKNAGTGLYDKIAKMRPPKVADLLVYVAE